MFVTYFFNIDMSDDQTMISFDHPFGRSTKVPTRLRCLSYRRASGDKRSITIDVSTGVAFGPNADMFNNYPGVGAR